MNGIGLREASRKYNVPYANLSHWATAGMIRIVRPAERRGQAMLLLERDVADLAAQYVPGRSRWNRPSLDKVILAS